MAGERVYPIPVDPHELAEQGPRHKNLTVDRRGLPAGVHDEANRLGGSSRSYDEETHRLLVEVRNRLDTLIEILQGIR